MQKVIISIGVLGLILSSLIIRLMVHNFIIEDTKEKSSNNNKWTSLNFNKF